MSLRAHTPILIILLLIADSVAGEAAGFDRKLLHDSQLAGHRRDLKETVPVANFTRPPTAQGTSDILISESISPARFSQDQGRLLHLRGGQWLAVWTDCRLGAKKIFGQLLDSLGAPSGRNFVLAGSGSGADFVDPKISQDTTGRVYLLFRDQTNGLIYATRFLADFTVDLNPFAVNTFDENSFAGLFDFAIYPNGRFVVTWEDYGPGGSFVMMRLFNSLGAPLTEPTAVNTDGGTAAHWAPSVAVRSDAGFLVCWEDYRSGNADVYARLYDGNGLPMGGDFAIVPPPDDAAEQYAPKVVYSPLCNYVISWLDTRSGQEVYLQRYSSTSGLIGGNRRISGPDSLTVNWDIDQAVSTDNTIAITWAAFGAENRILYQKFDAALNAIGASTGLNQISTDQRWGPTGRFRSVDRYGAVWTERRNGEGDVVFGIFDAGGQPIHAEELTVNDDSVGAISADPDIAWSSDRWILVVYSDQRYDEGDIFIRNILSSGETPSVSRRVNQDAGTDRQSCPSLATDGSTGLVVWLDDRQEGGISGQRIYGRFTDIWGGFKTNEFALSDPDQLAVKSEPRAAMTDNGRALAAWIDRRGGGPQVYAQWFLASGELIGGNFAVSDPAIESDNSDLHVGKDGAGRFYIIWVDRGGVAPVLKAKWYAADGSPGGSLTWSSPVAGVTIDAVAPAVHGDGLISILWTGFDNSIHRLYLAVVNNSGATIAANREITDNQAALAEQIDLAVDGQGYHAAVWIDHREGPGRAYYQILDANLLNEGVNEPVSTAPVEFMQTPSVSAHRGQAWFAWADPRENGLNIYATSYIYEPTDIGDGDNAPLPKFHYLAQNFPNPFNPSTTILFSLPRGSEVTLTVYNLLGQVTRVLADGYYEAGSHEAVWDGLDQSGHAVASGLYLYSLTVGNFSEQRKMLLVR